MRDTIATCADLISTAAIIVLAVALIVEAAAEGRAIKAAILAAIGSPVIVTHSLSIAFKLGWIGE